MSTEADIPKWLHNAFEATSAAKKDIALRMLWDELVAARAERDAAARDMVTVPRAFLDEVAAIPFFKNRKIEAIVREANALSALSDTPAVIATDRVTE